jgi:CYTH domain-containing protein
LFKKFKQFNFKIENKNLIKMLPKIIEIIILNYKYQLEHTSKFYKSLKKIKDISYHDINNFSMRSLNLNMINNKYTITNNEYQPGIPINDPGMKSIQLYIDTTINKKINKKIERLTILYKNYENEIKFNVIHLEHY